jgi:hypothetical protein
MIDGNTNSDFWAKSCWHTETPSNTFWGADMSTEKSIKQVIVTARGDCCPNHSANYYVTIGNDQNVRLNPKCGGVQSGSQTISCDLKGRYIGIYRDTAD